MITKKWFIKKISQFLRDDLSNRLHLLDSSKIFDPNPLVGIANGDDNIYKEYKKVIGEFHLTPKEAIEKFCLEKDKKLLNKHLSVVAYILPFHEKTKKENAKAVKMPSRRWAHSRLFGEKVNVKIQSYLVDELSNLGILACAPAAHLEIFDVNREIWASNWSQRHQCFAAGLGSFGLSDGFINSRGKAMRCGSIIVNMKLISDKKKRPKNPYEYCTFCGQCIERCPVDSISFKDKHNKSICAEHVYGTTDFIQNNYGIDMYTCGLCQVGVECSNGIPEKKSTSSHPSRL